MPASRVSSCRGHGWRKHSYAAKNAASTGGWTIGGTQPAMSPEQLIAAQTKALQRIEALTHRNLTAQASASTAISGDGGAEGRSGDVGSCDCASGQRRSASTANAKELRHRCETLGKPGVTGHWCSGLTQERAAHILVASCSQRTRPRSPAAHPR